MIDGRRVVVVVPAFEEALFVGRVVATMPGLVDRILVVDDGSGDETSAVARGAGDERVRVVRHSSRRGVGAAIATGYREALAETSHPEDAICVMAGDGQMDPGDLLEVALPIVRGEADYVKGDRWQDPAVRRAMGTPRFVGGWVFSRLTSLAIGQRISDSQCGYTSIARSALLAVDLDDLWPSFGYPNDLLGQLAARGLRIREVPVRPIYGAERSKLRLRHLPAIACLVARAAVRQIGRRSTPPERAACMVPAPGHDSGIECGPPARPRGRIEASEP